jgi:glutathione S-transferase
MYKLYHSPLSQHARRVVSLLEEAGIEYEVEPIAVEKGEHMSPAYMAVNPNHQLPAMEVDGEVMLESHAIMRFLCDTHGLDSWYPKVPRQRAGVDQWLDWNHCRLMTPVNTLVYNKVLLGENGDKAAIARSEAQLPEVFEVLEHHLQGRNFVAGDSPTIADLSIASNIFQLGFADAVPKSPNIGAWLGRVGELKGYRASLPPPPPQ